MSERNPKDPVRIVYHAENRTFARLFNEHSLEDVKNVVRRKLDLGRDTDVSLKQMGKDALLDLDDDDDFEAFRVHVKSSTSVDVRVTVGRSQGSPVPPLPPPPAFTPARASATPTIVTEEAPPWLSQEQQTATSIITSTPSSLQMPSSKSGAHLSTGSTRVKTLKTPESSARKRKVSFDEGASTSKKSAKRVTLTSAASSSAVHAETSADPKAPVVEEPPKKKRKSIAAKDPVREPSESSVADVVAPTPKTKKAVSSSKGREVEPSVSKDAETQEAVRKHKRRKKDENAATKSSAPAEQDGTSQPINPPDDTVNVPSPPLALEKPPIVSADDGELRDSLAGMMIALSREPGLVCASIPQTTKSTVVRSEVAAQILSGYRPKPQASVSKRNPVKRATPKSRPPISVVSAESTPEPYVSSKQVPNVPTDDRPAPEVLTGGSSRQTGGPTCPICMQEPFHIRYCCPVVLKGPEAIQERLERLKKTKAGDQSQLIKELECLLRDAKVKMQLSPNASQAEGESQGALHQHSASAPATPGIPNDFHVFEVTVESRGEGSSPESSDGAKDKDSSVAPRQPPTNGEPEVIIHGPTPKKPSILDAIDRIVGDQDSEVSGSESDDIEAALEEDSDGGSNRLRHQLSKSMKHSSESESGDEEESRSPSRSPENAPNIVQHVQKSSSKPAETFERQDGDIDIIMKDPVDPPAPEGQDDDSSEETHVGSEEDRMIVDHDLVGEKSASTIIEEHPVDFPLSDVRSTEPQKSGVVPAPNWEPTVSPSSGVPSEGDVDPIEPADDMDPPAIPGASSTDPIEISLEDGSLFAGAAQSTPKPGVAKRIQTRHGEILDDEAEQPVLLEDLDLEASDMVTPLPIKGRPRRKVVEPSASQGPVITRKSARFSSLPPSTSTPVALLNHRNGVGTRAGKAVKVPAKRSEESSGSQTVLHGGMATPSLVVWETLADPESPAAVLDEPSLLVDELMSSPHPEVIIPVRGRPRKGNEKDGEKEKEKRPRGRPRKAVVAPSSSQPDGSQEKERLFDLTPSQIPFPYSQHQNLNPNESQGQGSGAPSAFPNGEPTDSEDEPVPVTKMKIAPARSRSSYRSLSQLASQAIYSDLPTPASKSVVENKTKRRLMEDSSTESDSDEDEDEAVGSQHIPQGRRAGSALEAKRRKGLLFRI